MVKECLLCYMYVCVALATVELFNILQKYFYKLSFSFCDHDNNFSHPGTC